MTTTRLQMPREKKETIFRDEFTYSLNNWNNGGGISLSIDSGKMRFEHDERRDHVWKYLTGLEEGQKYKITFELDIGSSDKLNCLVRPYPYGKYGYNYDLLYNVGRSGTYSLTFTADSVDTAKVALVRNSSTGATKYFERAVLW